MLDDMQKQLYRQGMATFGGIAPTYHIELLERPTIVWDFHSLLLGVQMMFSFMLTDEKSSLKVCKHCGKAFVASRPNSVFCSPSFDRNEALRAQHELLKKKKERLERLIALTERRMEGEKEMSFQEFDSSEIERCKEKVPPLSPWRTP